jgi:hypothetical protein
MDAYPFLNMLSAGQSQRDCVVQPRVASNELPWEAVVRMINPNGVVAPSRALVSYHNSVGVEGRFYRPPRVARSSQPWAMILNPVGILAKLALFKDCDA